MLLFWKSWYIFEKRHHHLKKKIDYVCYTFSISASYCLSFFLCACFSSLFLIQLISFTVFLKIFSLKLFRFLGDRSLLRFVGSRYTSISLKIHFSKFGIFLWGYVECSSENISSIWKKWSPIWMISELIICAVLHQKLLLKRNNYILWQFSGLLEPMGFKTSLKFNII